MPTATAERILIFVIDQILHRVLRGHWSGKIKALNDIAIHGFENFDLLHVFHTFCDDADI